MAFMLSKLYPGIAPEDDRVILGGSFIKKNGKALKASHQRSEESNVFRPWEVELSIMPHAPTIDIEALHDDYLNHPQCVKRYFYIRAYRMDDVQRAAMLAFLNWWRKEEGYSDRQPFPDLLAIEAEPISEDSFARAWLDAKRCTVRFEGNFENPDYFAVKDPRYRPGENRIIVPQGSLAAPLPKKGASLIVAP